MGPAHAPLRGPSVLLLVAMLGIGAGPSACAREASPPDAATDARPSYCFDELAFTTELAKCPEAATTLAASRACRTRVHAACGFSEPSGDARDAGGGEHR